MFANPEIYNLLVSFVTNDQDLVRLNNPRFVAVCLMWHRRNLLEETIQRRIPESVPRAVAIAGMPDGGDMEEEEDED
jgi:hypothetical protein